MDKKKDYKNDLPSLKRQNTNLLKEREILRDEVRILVSEREDRNKKLGQLWSVLTDIKRQIEQIVEVPQSEGTDSDWDPLLRAVESALNEYVRLDNLSVRLAGDVGELKSDKHWLDAQLDYERNRSTLERLWSSFKRRWFPPRAEGE